MERSKYSSLEPNATYIHPDSHGVYRTDDYGRVVSFSADPRVTTKEERERNPENQRTLEGKGPGFSHAGHLVADRHGGSGEKFNIVPMQENVDSRDYAAFEKETDALQQQGYAVHYNGTLSYSGAEKTVGVNQAEAIMVERQTMGPVTGEVVDHEYVSFSNLDMAQYMDAGNKESEELMSSFSNPNAVAYDEDADLLIDENTGAVIGGPAEAEDTPADTETAGEAMADTEDDSLTL